MKPDAKSPARILVVDDDEISSRLLSRLLQKLGYEVAGVAVNAGEAIDMATALKPDLALMDILMPGGMDGTDAGALLVKCLDVPVVYVSGTDDDTLLQRVSQGDSYGFVSKPVNSRQLSNGVNMALNRHRAEVANRDAQRRLRLAHQAIEASDDMIIAVDPAYHYLFANTAFLRFHAKSADEVVGHTVEEIRGRDLFLSTIKSALDRCLAGERLQWETTLEDRNGVPRVHLASHFPLITESGLIEGVVAVIKDMTESRRARDEMINAQRLESLGTLAAGIAHDFNNSLGAILGYLDMMKELELVAGQGLKMVESAMKSCIKAKRLSQRLVTFAKGNKPVMEPVALQGVLAESAMQAFKGSDVTCEWDIQNGLPLAVIDAIQVSLVFGNIFTNARQAMGNTGSVRISMSTQPAQSISAHPLAPGEYLCVTVADTGPGISEHDLPRIFDPFFTTRPRAAGLGLAIAFSVVQKHGGHMAVVKTGNAGTVFSVWLPANAALPAGGDAAGTTASIICGSGRVLIMDDEPEVRDMAVLMVSSLGYEVTAACSGEEAAIAYATQLQAQKKFNAVILDLTVPGGMGGKSVLEQMLLIDPDIRAIASSGYSDDPIMATPEKYGFRGALPKPYAMVALSTVLRRVCEGS